MKSQRFLWMQLYGIAVFAIIMALIFVSRSDQNPIAVPVSLGFTAISLLASATGSAVRVIFKRLDEIAASNPSPPSDDLEK